MKLFAIAALSNKEKLAVLVVKAKTKEDAVAAALKRLKENDYEYKQYNIVIQEITKEICIDIL